MKIFLSLLLSASLPLFAADDRPTLVAVQMDQIADGYKSLKTQASDASQKDSSLALVSSMRQAVATARTGIPEPAEKLTGASADEFMTTFRKGLDELDAALQKLDAAIRAGDAAIIYATLDGINSLKKTYHSDLR
jgi:soluble cytochrome b562